jgi:hypothetical protein
MNESSNKSGNKEIWGCVGAIGAALIISTVTIIVALPTLIPFFRSSTQSAPTSIPLSNPTNEITITNNVQCSHFQVASSAQTMVTVPAGMWVVVRNCSPARSACSYTLEKSSGGEYMSYEHNGNADRYWVNAFCTETEAKNFANTDAKAMLEWWEYTQQNPFP